MQMKENKKEIAVAEEHRSNEKLQRVLIKATSETSDSSDSTDIHILHSPFSCKSDTLTIAKGEVTDKSDSGYLQVSHSKSACVLTSADIDSSNDEEETLS